MSWRKKKQLEGHAGAIFACAYDGKFLYTGSADKFVVRWNLEEGIQDKFSIKFEQSIYALAIVNQNYLVVGLANGALHVFDLHERLEKHYFTQHTKAIFSIKLNALKNQLYVGDADGNLSVWDASSFKLLIYLPLDVGKIRDIAVNKDGSQFVLACQDGTFRMFETAFFNEIGTQQAHEGGTTSVLFHPNDESILITGGKDALLASWDVKSLRKLNSQPAHNFAIYSIVTNTTGNCIITGSRDKTIKIWSPQLAFIQRLDLKEGGHRHSVNKVLILADNELVSISDDGKIIVWDSGNNF